MKKSNLTLRIIMMLSVFFSYCSVSYATPLGTSFIYQGHLPYNKTGFYDLQFKLFDSPDPNDSNQVGATNSFLDVPVDNGSFKLELDFVDANATAQDVWGTGQAQWLEISTKTTISPPNFTILTPRQQIMPAPFALYAQSAEPDSDWIISGSNMSTGVSGNIGIGKTNPNCKLDVSGTISGYSNSDTGVIGKSVSGAGLYGYSSSSVGVLGYGFTYCFYASGPGIRYGVPSSIRWKSDIKPIDNPLDKMMNLRGVYFNWDKEHGGKHDIGMIAEEVGKVLPETVAYEPNGEYASGMDYGKLTPLLVEAVKALKTENDSLKKRIEALEKQCSVYSIQHTETTER